MNIKEIKNIVENKELLLEVDVNLIKNKQTSVLKKIFEIITVIEVVFSIFFIFAILIYGMENVSFFKLLTFLIFYLIIILSLGISQKGLISNILHKVWYKNKINKMDEELLRKMNVSEYFYKKNDIIVINENYNSFNKEQKKFFHSYYDDYKSYIFYAICNFINNNEKDIIEKNKEFIAKVVSEEFSGKRFNKINDLIKDKFKEKSKIKILDGKEKKENELLKSFNKNKKKIKKTIIEI